MVEVAMGTVHTHFATLIGNRPEVGGCHVSFAVNVRHYEIHIAYRF